MAKMTLLDMVQNILSAMDSDTVNSYSDNEESEQIAEVIRETYFDIISNIAEFGEHKSLFQLEGLADSTKPTHMNIPSDVKSIYAVKYDIQTATDTDTNYVDIVYLDPEEFLNRVNSRNESDSNVQAVTDSTGVTLLILNDARPRFFTSFDNESFVFDSFDNTVDNTLQGSKTECYGLKEPTFTMSDTFVPDLDSDKFPLLLAESKATCFINFKQVSNAKEEGKARRQWTRIQNDLHKLKTSESDRLPNYGRRTGSIDRRKVLFGRNW